MLDGRIFGEEQRCFGCGPHHPHGFRLRFEIVGDEVLSRFVPTNDHQGAPRIMHGGLVTTVADEIAAWALIALRGKFGFTATMTSRFIAPLRIGVEAVGRSRITRDRGRIADIEVEIGQNDQRCFESTMRFVVLDRRGAERLLDGPIPESWEPYCR